MSSWMHLHRLRDGGQAEAPQQQRQPPASSVQPQYRTASKRWTLTDVNIPRKRLQIHQRCLYERTLPGHAFISAHVNRLQHGFYESTSLHEDNIDNVYFVSVHFVFHPHDPRSHRFKTAEIRVSVSGSEAPVADETHHAHASHPRILKHAPALMFGAVSPENLQWNFSLSSSLGVSQAPLAATLNPSGGIKSSYKVYDMMSIQGSIRSRRSPRGPEYDLEDTMAFWSLEENLLQRSGLPREFDFVLLVHKPDDVKNVFLTVDVDAEVEAWFGTYPKWYSNLAKFAPTQDYALNFNADIGQRFLPSLPGRGFNFASLPHPLDEYVTMPGTVYPTNDVRGEDSGGADSHKRFGDKFLPDDKAIEASPIAQLPSTPKRSSRTPGHDQSQEHRPNRHSWAPENMNVRVVLEHQYPPQGSDPRRFSYSPLSNQDPSRYPSIRRRKSRTGLKEYGARQALQELGQDGPRERDERENKSYETNGS